MVRTYVQKTDREKKPADIILTAVLEVTKQNKKMSEVSNFYDIPYGTLKYHVNKYKNTDLDENDAINKILDGNQTTVLTPELENLLASYIQHSAGIFMGLTPSDIRKLAYDSAEANQVNGIVLPESWVKNKEAGKDWFTGYMKRRPELSIRKPEATSFYRLSGFNEYTVDSFYSNLGKLYDKYNFVSADIYNMDESGLTTVHIPVKIVATKGEKQVGGTTTGERGETITLAATICAAGTVLPPFLIFPRQRFHDKFLEGAPKDSGGTAELSGYMKKPVFLKYLKHFEKYTRCSKERPVLLILDNHVSHISLEAIQYAKAHGIVMLTLPPHTTHKLQPLDVSIFGPLKTAKNTYCSDWVKSKPGTSMKITDIAPMLTKISGTVFTEENITSGFRKSGICPFNRLAFNENDFAPSTVLSRPLPAVELEETDQDLLENGIETGTKKSEIITPSMLRPPVVPEPRKEIKRTNSRKGKTTILTDTPEMEEIEKAEKEKEEKEKKKSAKKKSNADSKAIAAANVSKKKKAPKRKQKSAKTNLDDDIILDGEYIPTKKRKTRIIKIEHDSDNMMDTNDINDTASTSKDTENNVIVNDSGKRKRKKNTRFEDYCMEEN